MDTQEGEGQQPADPQPADPAVEEQGMEHWPWHASSSFCDISLPKTQPNESVSYFLNLQMIVKDFVHLYINLCWTTVLWNKLVMYEKEKHCLWLFVTPNIGMFGSLQY